MGGATTHESWVATSGMPPRPPGGVRVGASPPEPPGKATKVAYLVRGHKRASVGFGALPLRQPRIPTGGQGLNRRRRPRDNRQRRRMCPVQLRPRRPSATTHRLSIPVYPGITITTPAPQAPPAGSLIVIAGRSESTVGLLPAATAALTQARPVPGRSPRPQRGWYRASARFASPDDLSADRITTTRRGCVARSAMFGSREAKRAPSPPTATTHSPAPNHPPQPPTHTTHSLPLPLPRRKS
jgi:hypothetical protein